MRKSVAIFAMVLLGAVSALAASNAQQAQKDAARAVATRYLIQHRQELGLEDPTSQLVETRIEAGDTEASIHYQQVLSRVPIYGAEIILHLKNGEVFLLPNKLKSHLTISTTPKLAATAAVASFLGKLNLKGPYDLVSEPSLIILPRGVIKAGLPAADLLAWRVEVGVENEVDGTFDRSAYVDAQDGNVIYDWNPSKELTYIGYDPDFQGMYQRRNDISAAATVAKRTITTVDTAYLYSGCYGSGSTQNIPATFMPVCQVGVLNGQYAIVNVGDYVGNANNRDALRGKVITHSVSKTLTAAFGDGVVGSKSAETAGADAYTSLLLTLDYLRLVHGYVGQDGNNGLFYALVHWKVGDGSTTTSEWNHNCQCIRLGTAAGDKYDQTSLDIVAHEVGHGLAFFGPRFSAQSEADELEEANADILSMLVSISYERNGVPYWLGEQTLASNWNGSTFVPNVAIRYYDHPQRVPGMVVCYYNDIGLLPDHHLATGPVTHMMYLLTYGGLSDCNGATVSGLGASVTEKVWFRAFRQYLTSTSSFHDFRVAMLQASQDLFVGPSLTTLTVASAFDAVDIP